MLTQSSLLAPPRLPGVAGFWVRTGALILDLVFLHFVFRLLYPLLGDLPFQHPTAATTIAALLVYAYFVVADSEAGAALVALVKRSPVAPQPATLGKFLLGIRVTDLDGNTAPVKAVALRYLLLFAFVPVMLVVSWVGSDRPESPLELWVLNMTTALLAVALLAGHAVACAFNAFKQGMHDFVAGTMVRRTGEETLTFEAMTTQLGDFWRIHYRQPQLSAVISAVLVYASLGLLTWRRPDTSDAAERMRAAWRQLDAAQDAQPFLRGAQSSPLGQEPGPPVAGSDRPSTPTLTLALYRRELWQPDPRDPELRRQVEAFGQGYIDVLARSPMATKENAGAYPMRLSLHSQVYLIVAMASRLHSVHEFEVVLIPAGS